MKWMFFRRKQNPPIKTVVEWFKPDADSPWQHIAITTEFPYTVYVNGQPANAVAALGVWPRILTPVEVAGLYRVPPQKD